MTEPESVHTGNRRLVACQWLLALWLLLFLWSNLPGPLPGAAVAGALQFLVLMIFVAVHTSLAVGWRGVAAILLIGYMTGFAFEALSINTGFPFGWFVHNAPGPKPLGVPLYVPLGYAFLSWPAWVLACLLGRVDPARAGARARWIVPLLGALILAGYDLAYDAIGSTVGGLWSYRQPAGFFGVPLSNFVGWILTGWVILSCYALVEPRFASRRAAAAERRRYWLLPCLVWGAMTLQYPLLQLAPHAGEVIVGARRFAVADIYQASTIVALLTMLPAALAAAARAVLIVRPNSPSGVNPTRR